MEGISTHPPLTKNGHSNSNCLKLLYHNSQYLHASFSVWLCYDYLKLSILIPQRLDFHQNGVVFRQKKTIFINLTRPWATVCYRHLAELHKSWFWGLTNKQKVAQGLSYFQPGGVHYRIKGEGIPAGHKAINEKMSFKKLFGPPNMDPFPVHYQRFETQLSPRVVRPPVRAVFEALRVSKYGSLQSFTQWGIRADRQSCKKSVSCLLRYWPFLKENAYIFK